MNKKIIYILIIFLAIIAFGGFLVVKNKNKPLPITINQQPIIEEKVEEVAVATTTNEKKFDDWSGTASSTDTLTTYRNEYYNFKVSYPKEYLWRERDTRDYCEENPRGCGEITETNPRSLLYIENKYIEGYVDKDQIHIGMTIYKSDRSIKEWFRDYYANKKDRQTTYARKFGGDIIFQSFYGLDPGDNGVIYSGKELYVKNNEYIYFLDTVFLTEDTDKFLPIVNQIIDSFEFIK